MWRSCLGVGCVLFWNSYLWFCLLAVAQEGDKFSCYLQACFQLYLCLCSFCGLWEAWREVIKSSGFWGRRRSCISLEVKRVKSLVGRSDCLGFFPSAVPRMSCYCHSVSCRFQNLSCCGADNMQQISGASFLLGNMFLCQHGPLCMQVFQAYWGVCAPNVGKNNVLSPRPDGRWYEFRYTMVTVMPVCQCTLSSLRNPPRRLRAPRLTWTTSKQSELGCAAACVQLGSRSTTVQQRQELAATDLERTCKRCAGHARCSCCGLGHRDSLHRFLVLCNPTEWQHLYGDLMGTVIYVPLNKGKTKRYFKNMYLKKIKAKYWH